MSAPHPFLPFRLGCHFALSRNRPLTARRLATPDEIMRMRPDQLLLLRQGERPLAVEKIRFYDQREFAGLFDPA